MPQSRWHSLQKTLAPHQALLLSTPSHISYLTQFPFLVAEEREAFLIITIQKLYLLHAHFSPIPPQLPATFWAGTGPHFLKSHAEKICVADGITELKVETNNLIVDEYQALQTLPHLNLAKFDDTTLWAQRAVKTPEEIKAIAAAGRIAAQAFEQLPAFVKVGVTELELQRQLDMLMTQLGSEKPAFPTIVAFGAHAALPHHQPTTTRLTAETPVLCDFGATVNNYRSDMTRSFWFGQQPSAEFLKVEKLVKDAYQAALTELQPVSRSGSSSHPKNSAPPVTAQSVDQAARALITATGYGPQFIHTTGHGVGLDIHEPPSLSWKNLQPLQLHQVVTIEPGIYLEGQFGYRYENTVVIEKDRLRELTLKA